jgi:hypothetical protein
MRSWTLTTVAMAALLAGCQTQPLAITTFQSGGEGAPYSLRFTQFDTVVKWRVTSCGRHTPARGENPASILDKEFTVKAEITAEPTFPEDLSKRWLLDLGSLDGWINTTDLEVTYEGGKFKSFNATVTDKTAETATAVFTAAAKVATLLAAVGKPAGPDECADMVEAANQATSVVEGRTRDLAAARANLLLLQAQGAPKATVARQAAAVQFMANQLETATAVLEKSLKAVTYEDKFKWPASGSASPSAVIPIPDAALAQWKAQRWAGPAKSIGVTLELKAIAAGGELALAQPENADAISQMVAKGRLPVRVARPGALMAGLKTQEASSPLLRKDAAIIQSGDLVYVPVEYRWPRSNAAGFGIDANGYLSSMSHKQTSAPGETLGKALQAAAEQIKTVVPSDLEKLKAENEALTAQKTNLELKTALNPQEKNEQQLELEALQSELTLKKAKLELLQTDAALKLLQPQ